MIERVSSSSTPLHWPTAEEAMTTPLSPKQQHAQEAMAVRYVSTIASLQPQQIEQAKQQSKDVNSSAINADNRSWWSKVTDWFWGVLGMGEKEPSTVDNAALDEEAAVVSKNFEEEEVLPSPIDLRPSEWVPKLAPPSHTDKLSQAIIESTKERNQRLNEISELEDEMARAHSHRMDWMIFKELMASSMAQKHLKEESIQHTYDSTKRHQAHIKTLHKVYFDKKADIEESQHKQKVLNWVNAGTTALVVVGVAAGVALAPAGIVAGAFAVGIALLNLAKGGMTIAGGIMKNDSDKKTGEMHVVGTDRQLRFSHITDELKRLQSNSSEAADMIKQTASDLKNQNKVAREMARVS